MLAALYLDASLVSLSELSRATGVPLTTVQREVNRLERSALVVSSRRGNARLVALNPDSPYHPELSSLLLKAFGPAELIRRELAPLDGVEAAFIHGSWARRYAGEEGEQPRDIDLIVIGEVPPAAVHAAAREAERGLGRPVSATILTRSEWDQGNNPFLRAVRAGPLLEIPASR